MILPVHGLEPGVGERGCGTVRLRLRDPCVDEVVNHESICACDTGRADRADGKLDDEPPTKGTGGDEAIIELFGRNGLAHPNPRLDGIASDNLVDRFIVLRQRDVVELDAVDQAIELGLEAHRAIR